MFVMYVYLILFLAGDVGSPGPIGEKGLKGDRGFLGLKGDAGYCPPMSITASFKGSKGEKGHKGESGPQGIDGKCQYSKYGNHCLLN